MCGGDNYSKQGAWSAVSGYIQWKHIVGKDRKCAAYRSIAIFLIVRNFYFMILCEHVVSHPPLHGLLSIADCV